MPGEGLLVAASIGDLLLASIGCLDRAPKLGTELMAGDGAVVELGFAVGDEGEDAGGDGEEGDQPAPTRAQPGAPGRPGGR
ncbi:hypothetical protein CKO36_08100 [Rhabdochromatium marinum]|nr:hypothetical protein [Rhabdochromatium marinum]